MDEKLTQSEFEDLCAWLDGELDSQRADEIAKLVESDPAWAQACRELRSLNGTLNAWAAPALPDDLARRIARNAKRPVLSPWNKITRWATTTAAAAAIVLGLFMLVNKTPTQRPALTQSGPTVLAQAGQGGSTTMPALSATNARPMAFLNMTATDQQELLAKYEKLAATNWQEQNRWIIPVVASFTPAQLEQLNKMAPNQQMKVFLTRRAELIRDGKLPKQ